MPANKGKQQKTHAVARVSLVVWFVLVCTCSVREAWQVSVGEEPPNIKLRIRDISFILLNSGINIEGLFTHCNTWQKIFVQTFFSKQPNSATPCFSASVSVPTSMPEKLEKAVNFIVTALIFCFFENSPTECLALWDAGVNLLQNDDQCHKRKLKTSHAVRGN